MEWGQWPSVGVSDHTIMYKPMNVATLADLGLRKILIDKQQQGTATTKQHLAYCQITNGHYPLHQILLTVET